MRSRKTCPKVLIAHLHVVTRRRAQVVVSTRGGQPDLWIQRVATSEWWQLTDSAKKRVRSRLVADGTKIAYVWKPHRSLRRDHPGSTPVGVEPVSFRPSKGVSVTALARWTAGASQVRRS